MKDACSLHERLDALRVMAPRLDAVTDEASRLVAYVEKILVDDLHIGIPAAVAVGEYDAGIGENGSAMKRLDCLEFKRVNGRFRIAVTEVLREVGGKLNVRSVEDTPWPSCTREQKLKAAPALPRLLHVILAKSEALATEAEKASLAIKEMVGELPAGAVEGGE